MTASLPVPRPARNIAGDASLTPHNAQGGPAGPAGPRAARRRLGARHCRGVAPVSAPLFRGGQGHTAAEVEAGGAAFGVLVLLAVLLAAVAVVAFLGVL